MEFGIHQVTVLVTIEADMRASAQDFSVTFAVQGSGADSGVRKFTGAATFVFVAATDARPCVRQLQDTSTTGAGVGR
jgi:hypothetical protein